MQNLNPATDIYTGMDPTTSKYTNNLWYEICDVPAWNKMMKRVNEGLPPYENDKEDRTKGIAADAIVEEEVSETGSVKYGSVSVLNASKHSGAASGVANKLNASGFSAQAGNSNSTSNNCIIIYNEGNEAKAQGALEVLGDKFTVTKNDGSYPTNTDIVVIIGQNFK